MKTLTSGEILQACPIDIEAVEIEELDGKVYVKQMTASEHEKFSIGAAKGQLGVAGLVCMCACDESGNRIFTDGDLAKIGAASATVINKIFHAIIKVNKLAAGEVEELEKN